jgi:UDP-2-acetamido-2,6-beta-L-arabino-hexul-4-ose reductase
MKTVLVTGAGGFIGGHLCSRISTTADITLLTFTRDNSEAELAAMLLRSDVVFHLASVMRPEKPVEFDTTNVDMTQWIVNTLQVSSKKPVLVFTSSIQVALDNPYANSKSRAEMSVLRYSEKTGNPCVIYRLPNIFGPNARPNYTSVVATFCYNIAHGIDIDIHDPSKEIDLGYVDSVTDSFTGIINKYPELNGTSYESIETYPVSLQDLAELLYTFRESGAPRSGSKFEKDLYKTYLSYT